MKALKITNVNSDFGMFCMALNIRFAYSYGVFYILDSVKPEVFRAYCGKNDFNRASEMTIEPITFEHYCEL